MTEHATAKTNKPNAEAFINQTEYPYDSGTSTPNPQHQRNVITTVSTERTFLDHPLFRCWVELILIIPPVCFLVFAVLVVKNSGKPVYEDPVPTLQNAAKYGPTLFPIVFAAIIGNLLSAATSYKLEQGIAEESVEYLLRSRTVFTTVAAPFRLRSISILTPLLLVIWALSPLGGQGTIRIIETTPNTLSLPVEITYLNHSSQFPHLGPTHSGGGELMPAILGAFSSALSTPPKVKAAPQDAYDNIKIPMIESCKQDNWRDGWYYISNASDCSYSSLTGLPTKGIDRENYTFALETSYMYTNCSIRNSSTSFSLWREYVEDPSHTASNGQSWVIDSQDSEHYLNWTAPQQLTFSHSNSKYVGNESVAVVSNATCQLTTSYVEADTFCHGSTCHVTRIRNSNKPHNSTTHTGLDLDVPAAPLRVYGFFNSFINSTKTPWAYLMPEKQYYPSPIEYYFVNPDALYSPTEKDWRGVDIYPIGDTLFSQRFTQLLNTFWLASIAPPAVTGSFSLDENRTYHYNVSTTTASMTPNYVKMTYNKGWLAILVVASVMMLVALITTCVFKVLRQGPDVLDRMSALLRDHPHVRLKRISTMTYNFNRFEK